MFIYTYISHQQILVTCNFGPSLPYMVSLRDFKLANLCLGENVYFPSRQSDRQGGLPFFGQGSACYNTLGAEHAKQRMSSAGAPRMSNIGVLMDVSVVENMRQQQRQPRAADWAMFVPRRRYTRAQQGTAQPH